MKILKRILLLFLILIVLLFLIGFFLPKKSVITRSAIIEGTQKQTFEQINDFKNWDHWSKWNRIDTTMQKIYSTPSSGANATYNWESTNSNLGKGNMKIIYSTMDSIQLEMNFMEGGVAYTKFILEKVDDKKTKVIWSMSSDLENPMERWFGLMMNKMVGKDFETSLAQLNSFVAKMPKVDPTSKSFVQSTDTPFSYIYINKISDVLHLEKDKKETYNSLYEYLKTQKVEASGRPFLITHKDPKKPTSYDFALPISAEIKIFGDVNKAEMAAHDVLIYDYYGDTQKMDSAYIEIKSWMKENKKNIDGDVREEYIISGLESSDTATWHTKIYTPIK